MANLFSLAGLLCFVSLIVLAQSATLQVCPNGCQYSSVTSALQAAQSGDLVLVQTGYYANEATSNVVLLGDVALKGEPGATISLSFSYPINQWLTINGTLTLLGELTVQVNGGFSYDNSAIIVSPSGTLIQNGNLNILGGNARYNGFGVKVQGAFKQRGALIAVATSPTTFSAIVQLDQGTWTQEAGATVDMQLSFSTGVDLSTASSWLQKGNVNMRLSQSSNGVSCLNKNKVWSQQGNLNMTVSTFSVGVALTTGSWIGTGDVFVNVLDNQQGTDGIYCYNPTVNVVGHVLVKQSGACFTLQVPTRCLLKPVSCP
jgi:hypothetical protein